MSDSKWSMPESVVYARARELLDANEQAVLATVIDVEGNAYRRPGAKLLITPDGDGVGSITAGCLEDDIRRLAEDVLAAGEPRVETYDMMEDDDVWGLGVGCNGIIDVLLEPLMEAYRPVLNALNAGDSLGLATVVDGDAPTGARAYYRPGDGFTDDSDTPAWLQRAVKSDIRVCLDRERAQAVDVETDDGSSRVFVDTFTPAPKLVIVGSGQDVNPVVELATNVDFRTHVVGYRGTTATAERFPAADTIQSTSPAQLREVETFDENTYVVIMTHNFVDDRLTLETLLETPVPYVGLMGPRERFEELLETIDNETAPTSPDADFNQIYTPIGLDLGSGTPYGIAHSIVAEVLAVANDRDPDHLSAREGPIHERVKPSSRSR